MIVFKLKEYWPLSDRSIHYEVLNDPPLRNANDSSSRYVNNRASYQDLADLLTRARLEGHIPFEAIADPTRKVVIWPGHPTVRSFVTAEMETFLENYNRQKQLTQPHHIEIIGEKNTIEASIRSAAFYYDIPYTLGRGYCSLDPREKMAERFQKSKKKKLVLLVLSDFDPDGELIASSFAQSMVRDFDIPIGNIIARKVCLHWNQVQGRNLPQMFDIDPKKLKTPKFQAHIAKYGHHFHELETLTHEERPHLLHEAVLEILDQYAFDAELKREKRDQAKIKRLKAKIEPLLMKLLRGGRSD
jgi:hypothetical protein